MRSRQPPTRIPSLPELLTWMSTAKENLPAINDGLVPSDQILEMSALIDRMQRVALALEQRVAGEAVTERFDRAA